MGHSDLRFTVQPYSMAACSFLAAKNTFTSTMRPAFRHGCTRTICHAVPGPPFQQISILETKIYVLHGLRASKFMKHSQRLLSHSNNHPSHLQLRQHDACAKQRRLYHRRLHGSSSRRCNCAAAVLELVCCSNIGLVLYSERPMWFLR